MEVKASKLIYNSNLGRAIARAARRSRARRFHVISANRGRWALVAEGSVEVIKYFVTPKEAIDYAKKSRIGHDNSGSIIVHSEDGSSKKTIIHG
jgi:hypothetical protein